MSYTVQITETAKQDLREIALYIAEQAADPETAKRFISELRTECEKLRFPAQTGAFPKDRILKSLGYRYIPFKDYLIFYTINEENSAVNILAVFHSKRDYFRVMRKFI